MDVVLKPFIKLLIWLAVIGSIAKLAGVDVESLVSSVRETLENLTGQQDAQDAEG